MIRKAARGLIALAVVMLVLESVVGQQPMATPDKVVIRDKKDGSTKTYEGTIQFGPAGLVIIGPDKKTLAAFAPGDIVKITPGEMDKVDRTAMFSLISLEEKKTRGDTKTALLGYEDMKKKAGTVPDRTKRFFDFKIATLNNRILDDLSYDEKWAEAAAPVAKAWADFIADYKTGWEVWLAARNSTRIYAELNKFDEAARVWNRLTTKDAALPPDLKLEAQMNEIDAQIRTKTGAPTAQGAAEALGKAAAPGSAKDKLLIYEKTAKALAGGDPLAGVKDIEATIAATKDASTRGVAFGMLGELYMAANKPRDAMWAYLWVETVYNADKDDAFKAMCRLVEVFKLQQDDDRVRTYQEKLRRARGNF